MNTYMCDMCKTKMVGLANPGQCGNCYSRQVRMIAPTDAPSALASLKVDETLWERFDRERKGW